MQEREAARGTGSTSTSGADAAPGPRPKRRVHAVDRRLSKFLASVDEALAELGRQVGIGGALARARRLEQAPHHRMRQAPLFGGGPDRTVLIVFGATPHRPKEVYELAFQGIAHDPHGSMPPEIQEQYHRMSQDACRRVSLVPLGSRPDWADNAREWMQVLRQLVMESAALPEGPASGQPTKVHLLLQAREQEEGCPSPVRTGRPGRFCAELAPSNTRLPSHWPGLPATVGVSAEDEAGARAVGADRRLVPGTGVPGQPGRGAAGLLPTACIPLSWSGRGGEAAAADQSRPRRGRGRGSLLPAPSAAPGHACRAAQIIQVAEECPLRTK